MSVLSPKSNLVIFLDTPSATSLPGSAVGVTPSDLRDGPMTDLFGQALVPASPSRPLAPKLAAPIPAIFGRRGISSSASAALQSSLVSRLKQRLDTDGSTLFAMTWSEKTTPSGRSFCLLRASAHRTSGNACGSWPTPKAIEVARSEAFVKCREALSPLECLDPLPQPLHITAQLASWPTPRLSDTKTGSRILNEDGNRTNQEATMTYGANLSDKVKLASWPTPTAQDDFSANATMKRNVEGRQTGKQHPGTTLTDAARFTSWATPTTRDHKDGDSASCQNMPINSLLGRQIHLSGSPAETAKPGQLNPAFSRWLQGYPVSWCQAAIRVSRTLTLQRKRGSCG